MFQMPSAVRRKLSLMKFFWLQFKEYQGFAWISLRSWFFWGHVNIPLFVSVRLMSHGNRLWMNTVSHCRNEQTFLISLTGLRSEKYFWIGLSDIEEQGTFRWTNGETPYFTHWNTAMPGKFCMGSTPVTGVQLWLTQVCAFMSLFRN